MTVQASADGAAGRGAPAGEAPEALRRLRPRPVEDVAALTGSALGGLGLAWVLYERLLPTSGALGFALSWYAAFLLIYVLVTSQRHGATVVADRLAAVVVRSGAVVVGASLLLVIGYTFWRGREAVRHLNFLTSDLVFTDPGDLRQGGARHAIVGTLEQMTMAIAITLPLGVACAVFMTEVRGRLARVVRTFVEAMTALPSIVAGLFVYTAVIIGLGVERSGFAAVLAIGVMMLPIIARAADVVLRVVPGGLREASLALGASQWRTVWHVVLPTARPGLATALILGVARGVGETSPVLLTAGYSQFINANPFEGWQTSLPLYVFQLARLPSEAMVNRAFGAATVLLALVLLLFVTSRIIAAHRAGGRS